MSRKVLLICLICFCIFQQLEFSQTTNILPNSFYNKDEVLSYALKYGFITGGQADIEIKDSCVNGADIFHIIGTAKTIGIANKLFHVLDIYESIIEKESGLPILAIQNVREGRTYKYYNEVSFNRQNNTVTTTKSGEHKVKENTMDVLSAFYYIRRIDFSKVKEGDVIKLLTFFSDEEFPLKLRFRGRETIETKWGNIRCLKFAPVVEPGRVFKTKDDMLIWYTDDANRIPIKVIFELKVGHLTVELRSFSRLKSLPNFTK